MKFRMKSRFAAVVLAGATVLGSSVYGAMPASAQMDPPDQYNATVYFYVNGIKFLICQSTIASRSSDGRVQGKFYSMDLSSLGYKSHTCLGWVESKRLGAGGYNWTKVSNFYSVDNSTALSGWHWNGTNVGSRVCISDQDGADAGCTTGLW